MGFVGIQKNGVGSLTVARPHREDDVHDRDFLPASFPGGAFSGSPRWRHMHCDGMIGGSTELSRSLYIVDEATKGEGHCRSTD